MSSRIDTIVRWRVALTVLVVAVVAFVLANATVTGKNGQYPGDVSNIFWFLFLVLAVLLIVMGIVALFKRLRHQRPSPAA